jgi:hypothetical protein
MKSYPYFIIRPSFSRLMQAFEEKYFESFPEHPCSFCDILSPL